MTEFEKQMLVEMKKQTLQAEKQTNLAAYLGAITATALIPDEETRNAAVIFCYSNINEDKADELLKSTKGDLDD